MKRLYKELGLIGLLLSILFFLLWNKLPSHDPVTYFDFADKTTLLGVPNFFDVASNLIFLIAGIWGVNILSIARPKNLNSVLYVSAFSFCIGSILLCFGSAYFHWSPTPETLVWDRFPMTICFASMITILIGDRITHHGLWPIFIITLILSLLSAWLVRYGLEDLRPYIVVQLGSILILLMLLIRHPEKSISNKTLIFMFVFYMAAKALEHFDKPVYLMGHFISGHTLKHLSAGISILIFVKGMKRLWGTKFSELKA